MQNNKSNSQIKKFIKENMNDEKLTKAVNNLATNIKKCVKTINETVEYKKPIENGRDENCENRKKPSNECRKKNDKCFIYGFALMMIFSIGLIFLGGHHKDDRSETISTQDKNNQSLIAEEEINIENVSNNKVLNSPQDEIITIKNNLEFSKIMNNMDYTHLNEQIKPFINKTIEFDGSVINKTNHGEYKTRYDYLIQPGDYINDNTSNPGPIFKIEDVNDFDLNLISQYSTLFNCENIKIKGKIIDYNDVAQLVILEPFSITVK